MTLFTTRKLIDHLAATHPVLHFFRLQGKFLTKEKLQPYFDGGVKRVVVSAPVKEASGGFAIYSSSSTIHDTEFRVPWMDSGTHSLEVDNV